MKSKKIKTKLLTWQVAKVYTITLTLMFSTFPASLGAQGTATPPAAGASSANSGNWANAAISMIQSVSGAATGAYQQMLQQQMVQSQMMSLMPQVNQARYFPSCQVPMAISNFPTNVCENISDNSQLMMADNLTVLSQQYDSFYQRYISQAQNVAQPSGTQCLRQALSAFNQSLDSRVNRLQQIINDTNRQAQLFQADAQAMLDEMRRHNDILNGSSANTLANQTRDLGETFNDAACRRVLNDSVLTSASRGQAPNGGLRAVQAFMTTAGNSGSSFRDQARAVIDNEQTYRKQLEIQVQRIQSKISENGVDDFINNLSSFNPASGGLTQFQVMGPAVQQRVQEFQTAHARIRDYLQQNVGYSLPPMDNNFSSTIQSFTAQAGDYFRKKAINECVNGGDRSGIGLSQQQILDSLRVSGIGNKGTTGDAYRRELQRILAQDTFIEDKLAQIQALDQRFSVGTVTVRVQTSSGNLNYTPYQLYNELLNRCAADYNNDRTSSASTPGSQSPREKVQQAQRYLNELVSMHSSFGSDLASDISDQVLNCGDAASSTTACTNDNLSTSSSSFCLQTAVSCANSVKSCFEKTEQLITSHENSIRTVAQTRFTPLVTQFSSMQQNYLQMIQREVLTETTFFSQYFPNSPFKLPENLFVPMPQMADSEFGVQLPGGGNLEALFNNPESFAKQIDKLKTTLTNQKNEINQAVNQYISTQEEAIRANMQKWSELENKCKAAAQTYRANIARMNQEGSKQASEANARTQAACQRYNVFKSRPACGGANSASNVAEALWEVSGYINQEALANVTAFDAYCSSQSSATQATNGSTSTAAASTSPIMDWCLESGNASKGRDEFVQYLKQQALQNVAELLRQLNTTSTRSNQYTEEQIRGFINNSEALDEGVSTDLRTNGGSAGQLILNLRDKVSSISGADNNFRCSGGNSVFGAAAAPTGQALTDRRQAIVTGTASTALPQSIITANASLTQLRENRAALTRQAAARQVGERPEIADIPCTTSTDSGRGDPLLEQLQNFDQNIQQMMNPTNTIGR